MLVPAEPNPVCYCSCHLAFTQLSAHLSTTLALQLIKFLTTLCPSSGNVYSFYRQFCFSNDVTTVLWFVPLRLDFFLINLMSWLHAKIFFSEMSPLSALALVSV